MKKVFKGNPNQQLKAERELRGWSQKYVAEQLGADHYYLSRWERGSAVPSPYYRQKLCTLFGKNARELGLLQEDAPLLHEVPAQEQEVPSVTIPQSMEKEVHDPTMPLFVAEGIGIVGRDGLVHRLKECLCRERGIALTALGGLPGAGKTTLAASVARDADVLEHFADGILWAGLGPNPDVLSHLSRWGTLLGVPAIEATRLTNIEEWIKTLRLIIGTRRLLLIIDDVWRIEAALAFKVGGPHCAYLMTTRFPPIALQFAPNDAIVVPELAENDGITLLTRFAPEVVASEPVQARRLVKAVGGLPLALTIMGKYLQKEAHSRQPRRIRAALDRLQHVQERLLLTVPHALSERSPSLPAGTPVSLQTVIEVGDQRLDEQARGALYALSVFPARPNSFSEESAAAVSGVPVEVLDALTDAGLLEGSEQGRYTMHQTIADYAQTHLKESSVYGRFVEYMTHYVESHQKDHEALDQESANILNALQVAVEGEHSVELVRCTNAFVPFLLTRGLFTLAEGHLLQAEQAARLLRDDRGLATVLSHLGKVHESHGDYSKAETTLQEGLTLARQNEDSEQLCRILQTLGTVARNRGAYHQAELYHQEGLTLARQLGDHELITILLLGLGVDYGEQGRYEQEEACYQEGIAIARQVGDQEHLCELLLNLGQAVFARGDYILAMAYSQQALQLCRQIGYRYALTTLLINLGGMATEQKDYAQAEAYLQEALEIARQMENRNRIGVSLVNLGAAAMEQGIYAQAEAYLQEALEIARQIGRHWLLCGALHTKGNLDLRMQRFDEASSTFQEILSITSEGNQEYQAVAYYGLARVAQSQRDILNARELGQESLRLLESIGNRQAPEVKAWLHLLPFEVEDQIGE
jgi:tetratricopeptide (TPR) repeat protein/transcriptional regulator with XRE-family HTH domain